MKKKGLYGVITAPAGPDLGVAGCQPGINPHQVGDPPLRHQRNSSTALVTNKFSTRVQREISKRATGKARSICAPLRIELDSGWWRQMHSLLGHQPQCGKKLVIHEFDDVYDSVTGRALTGSWTWDSAIVLSHWMITQGQLDFDFAGKTVLELGAGTGLPGLTAAALGASRVILTDVEPLLPVLRKNVEANGLGDRVEVSRLVWGSEEELEDEVAVVDLVVMSDVFFDAEEAVALGRTLRRVCGEGTKVWGGE
ncbi:unnamed protein product [Camellia sinensis]